MEGGSPFCFVRLEQIKQASHSLYPTLAGLILFPPPFLLSVLCACCGLNPASARKTNQK
jgi:hypothetical protein